MKQKRTVSILIDEPKTESVQIPVRIVHKPRVRELIDAIEQDRVDWTDESLVSDLEELFALLGRRLR